MSGDTQHVGRQKLIEVSLPLQKINEESAREKSIRHGHPSTLHLWWSRKPLATARAVLFAQLVDDPSSRPDLYPTEEDQTLARKKLHELIERLVVWENSNDEALLREAHQKILESTGGNPPPILDPFAGGGSIPLEAQRLGLEAHASDLNPVAVLINKALIEIPPKFAGRPPVFPGAAEETIQNWPRATGLAEDVRRYGQWMRDEAEKRIGHLYPKATLPDGSKATVIAWIWARTVTCPNPECRIQMPLTSKWWLGKKKGKEAYIVPVIEGKTVRFTIGHDPKTAPTAETDGTVGRNGATCVRCSASVDFDYIRTEGRAGRLSRQMMATVAEGRRRRIYLPPTTTDINSADVARPDHLPTGKIPESAPGFRIRAYGFDSYTDMFTSRQLTTLSTLVSLIGQVRSNAVASAAENTILPKHGHEGDNKTAEAHGDAIATYLSLALSRYTNYINSFCRWRPDKGKEQVGDLFALQAIPMTWDYAEANPFSNSAGGWIPSLRFIPKVLDRICTSSIGQTEQNSAVQAFGEVGTVLSTDPPYYDNIGYSDLSDFFYIWLRDSLHGVYNELLSTILVPKSDELVANKFRHSNKETARKFFIDGFQKVFTEARRAAAEDIPATIYYAFKQQDVSQQGLSSTGWETLLEGMIRTGWQITATWPMRSELGNRMLAQGTNALASSIVLACRPRPETAARTDRRGFMNALKAELPARLRELQQGAIAPVDLPQAVIGPGMTVFSRYSAVLEDDGSTMTVRTALQLINTILDEVLTELENDFDKETRFALTWFRIHAFDTGTFGDAESIANGRGVNLDALERSGILTKGGGKVALVAPSDMTEGYDPATDTSISQWAVVMHLTRVLADSGVPAAAALLGRVPQSVDWDLCKELANLMFKLAEDQKKAKLAVDFNNLGAAWNDIARQAPQSSFQPTLLP
ncbi:DUF1156 domain-containing protein [Gordonia sp. NB41Y]|uniref:DUF1156 domain-containing protein n=1 Tax=Gordonia sp. NB41Y TaxID=875808 RepID=UPI0006B16A2D|nr:DUF1156 domain-containing protein [Gordonia sp. NB41Y]EMP14274.2 hypothetical protein ISGA_2025 [Gordonia sp. NB41Y]WLP91685.1 DUF1156 domain-containing protein [Gordonia sp. NB41Y]